MSVAIARCESSMSRAPAFYGSLLVCMIAQGSAFWYVAPPVYSFALPAIVSIFAASRLIWCLTAREKTTTEETARADLRRSTCIILLVLASVLGTDYNLMRYADEQTALFLLLTLLAWSLVGAYCTFYIPGIGFATLAAPLISLVFSWQHLSDAVVIGAALCTLSFCAATAYALRRHSGDFISLIETRAEAQKLSDDNFRLASTDALTGLAGRRQFFSDLERLGAEGRYSRKRLAVAIADLDGFKPINDRHGHLAGDGVLEAVAARLSKGFGGFRHVYRLGGDEFALIAPDVHDTDLLVAQANALIASVGQPINLNDISVSTGCTIGIAIAPDSFTPSSLYERADYALYHAKRAGRNRALLFTSDHERLIRSQAIIEQELRGADFAKEFYLVFQPIVRAADAEVLGFECLARWRSPTLGDVSPGTFIQVAEQSGLVRNLTPVLLRKALAEAARWPDHLRVSFNLSPLDISSNEQILVLIAIVGQSGISPRRIDFELTETALLNNFETARHNMATLKGIGANVSLDDFGTGHSSLSHLHALPLDKIKIDRSFVRDIEHDLPGRTIIRSMMNLCRDLNLGCVVEGVETSAQLQVLREFGCDQIQGYYFSKPIEPAEITSYLNRARILAA